MENSLSARLPVLATADADCSSYNGQKNKCNNLGGEACKWRPNKGVCETIGTCPTCPLAHSDHPVSVWIWQGQCHLDGGFLFNLTDKWHPILIDATTMCMVWHAASPSLSPTNHFPWVCVVTCRAVCFVSLKAILIRLGLTGPPTSLWPTPQTPALTRTMVQRTRTVIPVRITDSLWMMMRMIYGERWRIKY